MWWEQHVQRPRGGERAEVQGSVKGKVGGCSCSGNHKPVPGSQDFTAQME